MLQAAHKPVLPNSLKIEGKAQSVVVNVVSSSGDGGGRCEWSEITHGTAATIIHARITPAAPNR